MEVRFEGIGDITATFECEGVSPGDFVSLTGNGKVGKCKDSEAPVGVCKNVWGGIASVQLSGYVRVPAGESITAPGLKSVQVTSGKLEDVELGGRQVIILDVDGGTAGVLL